MCEYCGCQALTAIDELTREHDLVIRLISDVKAARAAADQDRLAVLARTIMEVLEPHVSVEEAGLFPPMIEEFPEQIAALEAEHASIHAVLGEAADGPPSDPSWPDRLSSTLHTLRQHILTEQDGVFPAALASLKTEDWEEIDRVRARVGSQLRLAD